MQINLIFIGDSKVGKTSLIQRFANQSLTDYEPTIRNSIKQQINQITFNFTDICCLDYYKSIRQNLYRCQNIIVIVFDISQIATFHSIIQQWSVEIAPFTAATKIIIANKLDLIQNSEQIEEYKTQVKQIFRDSSFFCCSALTELQIKETFEDLAQISKIHLSNTQQPRESFCSCNIF